jgi:hypothetical protein
MWKEEFHTEMDLRKMACEDPKQMELSQNCVQWQILIRTVLNIWVQLSQLLI